MPTEKKYIQISHGISIEVDVDITDEALAERIEKWKASKAKSENHTHNPKPKKIKNYNQ